MFKNLNRRALLATLSMSFIVSCGSDNTPSAPVNEGNSKPPVKVVDSVKPVVTLNGANSITIWQGDAYTELGAAASDNVDGTLEVSISGSVDTSIAATYNILYQATDAAGNVGQNTRKVIVVADEEEPELTLQGSDSLTLYLGDEYIELGAKAQDNKDGELEVKVTGTVDHTAMGYYTLTYSATDSSGNKSEVERQVTFAQKPNVHSYKLAKLNSDNQLDLLTVSNNGLGIQLSMLPSAIDNTPNNLIQLDHITDETFVLLETSDIDSDGDQDIFLVTKTRWYLYENLGNNSFSQKQNILSNWIADDVPEDSKADVIPSHSLEVADINGDGIKDLAWQSNYDDSYAQYSLLNVSFRNEDGTYQPKRIVAMGSEDTYSDIRNTINYKLLDVDNDDVLEVVVDEYSWDYRFDTPGDSKLISFDYKDGGFESSTLFSANSIYNFFMEDQNDDGIDDLNLSYVINSPTYDKSKVWLAVNHDGTLGTPQKFENYSDDTYLDLDNDGILDLVGISKFNGIRTVYWQRGTINGLDEIEPLFKSDGHIKFTDVNEDGFLDYTSLSSEVGKVQLFTSPGVYRTQTIMSPSMAMQRHGYESDHWSPVITLNGSSKMFQQFNAAYVELGGTATDETDGEIPLKISGSIDTASQGLFYITYTANDNAGNETSIKREVIINPDAFVMTWRTQTVEEEITIITQGSGYLYDINWGDNSHDENVTGDISHTYEEPGEYIVSITGSFPSLNQRPGRNHIYYSNAKKLVSIEQWGNIQWRSMSGIFAHTTNLRINANDEPDLSIVTDMSYAFHSTYGLSGDLSKWDVSNITNLSRAFSRGRYFDIDLSNWSISSVTDMSYAFGDTRELNIGIGNWDTSALINMNGSFTGATSLQDNIEGWDVSNVKNMQRLFSDSTGFSQDISAWDVRSVTNMSGMFSSSEIFPYSGTSMTVENYDKLLISWSKLPLQSSVSFDAGRSQYSEAATEARQKLIEEFGWSIYDEGPAQ